MKYKIKSLDLDSAKTSDVSFESIEVKENIKNNVFLIYNNQKKDRVVYSFTKSRSDFTSGGAKPYRQKGTGRARLEQIAHLLKLVVLLYLVQNQDRVSRKTNDKFFKSF